MRQLIISTTTTAPLLINFSAHRLNTIPSRVVYKSSSLRKNSLAAAASHGNKFIPRVNNNNNSTVKRNRSMMIFIRAAVAVVLHDIKYLANIWNKAPFSELCIKYLPHVAQTLFMLFYSSDNGPTSSLSLPTGCNIFLFPPPLFFYLKGLAAASYIIVQPLHRGELNRLPVVAPAKFIAIRV